ncbi:hypothetical protein [Paraburkholderia unamae]|uniref:hypothetical protein n=1 Tax=Paraburkholderia unamae TaxID=219649 RepID=UPI0011BFC5B7|nr:hypothetical protein [Paraburkholderia unamae]
MVYDVRGAHGVSSTHLKSERLYEWTPSLDYVAKRTEAHVRAMQPFPSTPKPIRFRFPMSGGLFATIFSDILYAESLRLQRRPTRKTK